MTGRNAHCWTAIRTAAILALAAMLALPATGAVAQERPRTLFEFLFSGQPNRAERKERPRVKEQRPRTTTRRTSNTAATAPARPAPAEVAKNDDARTILVVGDFLAGGLAEGLSSAFEENPGVRVVGRSNGSSGFVRDDYYDWPGEFPAIAAEVKPAAIVVMIGSNDRQQMRVADSREQPRSEAWNREYQERARRFASLLSEQKVPVIWVGMPPFRPGSMSSDMLAFNDMYRIAVEGIGGTFVDIWDGFVDENGGFAATGPDINGQPARLRAGDGINMTAAGKRKIAFYAERPLKRIFEGGGVSNLPMPGFPELAGPPMPDAPSTIDRTQPIALTDPELDGGAELLGAVVEPASDPEASPAARLAAEGVAPAPRAGRVDDFRIVSDRPASPASDDAARTMSIPQETTGAQ